MFWRRQWHPTPVLLPGKSHGQRSLVGCSPWGRYESDTTERLHFDFSLSCIGEGNGNPLQCSCLENPRDGEPGGLPSMGSHRVGHDWSDLAAAAGFNFFIVLIIFPGKHCNPEEVLRTRAELRNEGPGAKRNENTMSQVKLVFVQSLSCVLLFVTLWTATCQASLSSTISWILLKFLSISLMMPSNYLILCHPLLLLPSVLLSIREFSNELSHHIRWPKYWSFSISPSSEYSGLIYFRID